MRLRLCDKCFVETPTRYFIIKVYAANSKSHIDYKRVEYCSKCFMGLHIK